MIYFEIISKLHKKIRVTLNHWLLISERKHLELQGKEKEVQLALIDPIEIRESQEDSNVFLYYRRIEKYFVCVICRHENGTGFIITAYITDKIKEGRKRWIK